MNDALELLVLTHKERGDILTLHEYPRVIRNMFKRLTMHF